MPLISGMRTSVTTQPGSSFGSDVEEGRGRLVGRAPSSPAVSQQERERIAHRLVVVDDVDDRLRRHRRHPPSLTAGSVKRKIVPPPGLGSDPDASAMRLDDGARDRQADAHALALGGDERLEQLLGDLRRDARSRCRRR